jgi:phosphoribosylanthranilate isomerase
VRPLVKICGITRQTDALFCADRGAAALGFIFYEKSPRYIDPAKAARIIASLPPFVTPVGVFVNQGRRVIDAIVRQTGIRLIQLSGDESPEDCRGYPIPTIKAFRVRPGQSLRPLLKYRVAAALLDGAGDGLYGGSGRLADFKVALAMKKHFLLILAGGLTPRNVVHAVRAVEPHAIDVCSGVESSPGKKDRQKIESLFHRINEQTERP